MTPKSSRCDYCGERVREREALRLIGVGADLCQQCAANPEATDWFTGWNVITHVRGR